MEQLRAKLSAYGMLSEETMADLAQLLRPHFYARGDYFLREGQTPRNIAFIVKGLFSQYYASPDGDMVIKKFFPENHFAGSVPALLTHSPSIFAIRALEHTETLEYNFYDFKALTEKHRDLAAFYIRYMELHWIIEKEPLEISFRHDNAKKRYLNFLKEYPNLEPRLKQHEIASYLGITPTQLSRIRADM
ncbi:Crp/Fnr family transcriptional regulator [Dyadobacter sp. CY261]|uniref:Crp/Fnr family transcriptional regulator n=1 Tax=Dyadobacter sp. CY261 TaxID=2907203 RepID=UPI001F2C8BE8|nr:Crp/Fnr family transcriptional regulator [Dyadobacter sp. CY261]MCF0069288.1 Crp/Fnr family transcriptional regulator [Dyadobacter sp. CY261]